MKRWRLYILGLLLAVIALLGYFVSHELQTSELQAKFFSKIGKQLTWSLGQGPSSEIRFPKVGPFDERLGYTRIPEVMSSLVKNGYEITEQARLSPRFLQLVDEGIFPIYREKNSSGLRIVDRADVALYSAIRPERAFPSYNQIPPIVVQTLLFIENREILDSRYPFKNPAVEWDRLGKAVLEKAVQEIFPDRSAPGGSTLATQLEKYRHAYEGRTRTAKDKFQQMLSASFRAYLDGPSTLERRFTIILDYINSIPLAALPGYGEVNGLGDGLWAWYEADLAEVSSLLNEPKNISDPARLAKLAKAYKMVLSLFIAHRRPSGFLLGNVDVLNELTNEYLSLLASHNVISKELRDAAQLVQLQFRSTAPTPPVLSYLDRKAANAIRMQLLSYLKMSKLYNLDQIDVSVRSTIDKDAQDRVTQALRSLQTREGAKAFDLAGDRTLDQGDPKKVVYSVTLYEHVKGANLLRIQTDNYDRPFSINEGTKLDLGSTAKLRTLANYLHVVSEVYAAHSAKSTAELKAQAKLAADPITTWVLEFLVSQPQTSLETLLDAAMERRYSASPGETFFTGGGIHRFVNFKPEDNGKVPTLSEAIRFSINLPFIRLIRDLVRYYMAQIPGSPTRSADPSNEEARQAYLAKFADREGTYFLEQFYVKYKKFGKTERFAEMVRSLKLLPVRLAAVHRYVYPEATLQEFSAFLSAWLPFSTLSAATTQDLYEKYGPGKFSLQDQGYIAKLHPLELWLVRYLEANPKATFKDVVIASAAERQVVYEWLFKTKHRQAQDSRIKVLVETEAFLRMHQDWKRFGYPFDYLVPSFATAIGTSGDRPSALAELVGIIRNNGVRYPNVRIDELHFAAGTPFDTRFRFGERPAEQVMKPEVAVKLREALADVVANGTARRVFKAFTTSEGQDIEVGGKTGTGDHRYETFGGGGQLISSRVVNRTATFTFFIGDHFFGVVTAHVHGPEAAQYRFTSALAAGLLRALAPALTPLIRERLDFDRVDRTQAPFCPLLLSAPILTEQFIRELHLEKETRACTLPLSKLQPIPALTATPTATPSPAKSPRPSPTATPTLAAKKPTVLPSPQPSATETPGDLAPLRAPNKAPEGKVAEGKAAEGKAPVRKALPTAEPSATETPTAPPLVSSVKKRPRPLHELLKPGIEFSPELLETPPLN